MDEVRIPPAGDGFYAKGLHDDQDHPHACMDGLVYLGYTVVDGESGEEVEEYAHYLCRRCSEERGW